MLVTAYYRLTVNSVGRFFLLSFRYTRYRHSRSFGGSPKGFLGTQLASLVLYTHAIGSCQIEPLAFSTHRQKCFPRVSRFDSHAWGCATFHT